MGVKKPLLKNALLMTPYLNSGLFMPAMQVSMNTGTPSSTYELLFCARMSNNVAVKIIGSPMHSEYS